MVLSDFAVASSVSNSAHRVNRWRMPGKPRKSVGGGGSSRERPIHSKCIITLGYQRLAMPIMAAPIAADVALEHAV